MHIYLMLSNCYLFPPFSFIRWTLQKTCMDQTEVLVVPKSALVQMFSGNVTAGNICGDSTQRKSTSITKIRGTAPFVAETDTSDKEGFREVFLRQGFDNDTADILMASCRKSPFPSNSLYMSKWFEFASCNKVSPVELPIQFALAFLTSLVRQGKSFNQICVARSALPSVITSSKVLVLVIPLLSRNIWKEYLKTTLCCLSFSWHGMFIYFIIFSAICRRSKD